MVTANMMVVGIEVRVVMALVVAVVVVMTLVEAMGLGGACKDLGRGWRVL